MEAVLEDCLRSLDKIVAGVPIDFNAVKGDDIKKNIMLIALHCVVNGPVGVNKKTTFPLVGEASIKGLVPCTNSQWKSFCALVAQDMVNRGIRMDCNTMRRFKNYWPLY
jgi:hypothetical protein